MKIKGWTEQEAKDRASSLNFAHTINRHWYRETNAVAFFDMLWQEWAVRTDDEYRRPGFYTVERKRRSGLKERSRVMNLN